MVETHYEFLLQRRLLNSLFSLLLYPDNKPWPYLYPDNKVIHTLEDLFIFLYLDLRKGLHIKKRNSLGSSLVEASGDFTPKNGSQLPGQTYKQGRSSGEVNKLCAVCWSL